VKIINVVGARPNLMKIAPLMKAYATQKDIDPVLVHTGQHYDTNMSDLFFRQLGIRKADLNLGISGDSHAVQTAEIMKAFEPVACNYEPDAVLVVGDVNSTIACGLVAVKLGIKLVHVEAGLRSFDRTMPEEINRVLTDAISNLLFCTEDSAVKNLRNEGIAQERIHLVGNLMIDTLLNCKEKAAKSDLLEELDLEPRRYAVLTLHRPSNVDDPQAMEQIFDALNIIQQDIPIVFPVHPRTRKSLAGSRLGKRAQDMSGLLLLDPMGYLDFVGLMSQAKLVLTDSGGIQEETTILKIPCLTLRENTERPVTIEKGTNRIVGRDPDAIVAAYRDITERRCLETGRPPLWDGRAAERIVRILVEML